MNKKRSRAARKVLQDSMEYSAVGICALLISTISDIATTTQGGYRAWLMVGMKLDSKTSLMRALRECAEWLGITLIFTFNDRSIALDFKCQYYHVGTDSFRIEARLNDGLTGELLSGTKLSPHWILLKRTILGERGRVKRKGSCKPLTVT